MRSAKVLLAVALACAAVVAQTPAPKKQQPKAKTEAKQHEQPAPTDQKQDQKPQQQQPAAGAPASSPVADSAATSPQISQIVVKEASDNYTARRDYLLGPSDVLELRVFDEPQLNGDFEVDADGNVIFPFVDQPLVAQCRSVNALRKDLTESLAKFLKNPRVFLRVKEQRSHKPAIVYGAVLKPAPYELHRPARLLELLSDSGGVTEQHSGTIQITHTEPPMCPGEDPAAVIGATPSGTTALGQPYTLYSVTDLRQGKADANPYIRNGDVIWVAEASPIYVVGNVAQPTSLYLKDGMTLGRVMAMVGGAKAANEEKVVIHRLKPNSSEAELLTVNYKAIRQGKEKDVELKPYDIIEVPKQGFNAKMLLDTVVGISRSSAGAILVNAAPRIIY